MIKRKTPFIRKTRSIKRKPLKVKKSDLQKADDEFSLIIRARDIHCQHPVGCAATKTQCSHFIGRATKSTRFDPDNCIALCYFHHFRSKELGLEYQKQTIEKRGFDGWYTRIMKESLGPERYAALIERSKTSVKLRVAIDSFRNNQALTQALNQAQ